MTVLLPLVNSLTHFTYPTSTSPRIMTIDGSLERLVLGLLLLAPGPGKPVGNLLLPPSSRPPKQIPTLNTAQFDEDVAHRFSLAFQCVVNSDVRGSEQIRRRVVQAEGHSMWLGIFLKLGRQTSFSVGSSSNAPGDERATTCEETRRGENR